MRVVCLLAVLIGCGSDVSTMDAWDEPADDLAPTYHRDVASILIPHCAGCHRDGGVGPFALTSYEQASEVAHEIVEATTQRIMPPWPADASGACGTFVGQRRLSDAQIATLSKWVAAGVHAGDPADAPPTSIPPEPAFTEAVELASDQAYAVMPGPDEYRCFVVDPGLAADRYLTAMAVRLDQAAVVHHIQVFAADSPYTDTSIAAQDAADPAPGYACDNEGVGPGLRYVGVWAAGDLVRRWPEDSGILLRAGRRIVLQVHYHNHGSELVVDHSRVALELVDGVAAPGVISSAAGSPLNLAPGQADVEVSALRLLPISQPAWIKAARIHMHELGTHARFELVRGDQTLCLLDIPRWDFGWQLFYTFDHPIAVEPGDRVRIRCSYDTRSRSEPVTWGISTEDEMCLGYTYLTP